jgi:outer membrane protein assembly factor BamB/predicted phosphodiesterase
MHWRLPREWRFAVAGHLVAALLLPAAHTFATRIGGPAEVQSNVAPQVLVTGNVFEDLNADGARGEGEPGLGGIAVSNGVDVFVTDPDGSFSVPVTRDDSRYVLLTVPRGFRSTRGFHHRIGPEAADSTSFGLTADATADRPAFRFVHASDPHVHDATTGAEFGQALAEIAALDPPADFVVVTGDLVNNGSAGQLVHAAAAIQSAAIPIFPAYGDHDADPDSLLVRTYETLIGPTYYSFDRGPYHFIIYNNVRSASFDGSFKQQTWLANDIAQVPLESQIYVFTHFQPDRAEIDVYRSLGVDAVFSGHWHANRSQALEGVLSLNSGTLRMAGIDRSSPGFRLVELGGSDLATEVRIGGIPPRLAIVDPPAGAVPFGPVPIRAMGYSTSEPGLTARFTVTGAAGEVAAGDLDVAGGWGFGGEWNASGLEAGAYSITVEVLGASGVLATATREVTLEQRAAPPIQPGLPWSQFRGNASGTGALGTDLRPPLTLAWTRYVGGPAGLASPVIADGRVFVAHGASGSPANAAVAAFDLVSGAELWRTPTNAEVKGAPAVADGRVIAVTSNGKVLALDAGTGELVWRRTQGDSASRHDVSAPSIAGGVVYAGGGSVSGAFDFATGDPLWQRNLGSDWLATVYSAPAISGSRVAFALFSGLHVLDRETGATLWSRALDERETTRSVAIAGDVVYGAGNTFGNQRLRAFDLASGAELWSAPFHVGNSNSAPAVADSAIIIGSGTQNNGGALEAFARSDGQHLWSVPVGSPIATSLPYFRVSPIVTSSPLVAGEHVYCGADDGIFRGVRITDGSVVWSADLGAPIRSSPAASGNVLLVLTVDGTLFAFVSGDPVTLGSDDGPAGAPPIRTAIGIPWPNPFRPAGTIPIDVAGPGAGVLDARLDIYDVQGRKVRTLVSGPLAQGRHLQRWDGRDARGQEVASGVYFLRLDVTGGAAGSSVATARLSIVR